MELLDLEGKSLTEIGLWVDESKIICDCTTWKYGGKRGDIILEGRNIKSYPHDAGILVEGHEEKQWAYVHCSACGYDWALWKLVNRAKTEWTHR